MNTTKGAQVQALLRKLTDRVPEALIAITASSEGFSIASVRRSLSNREEDTLAVAATQILEMSLKVNETLNQGKIGRVLIEGSQRTTIVTSAGRDLILIVVVPAEAKLGLVMMAIGQIAQEVAQVYD